MDSSKTTILRKKTHFTKIDAPLSQNNIIKFFFLCVCSLLKDCDSQIWSNSNLFNWNFIRCPNVKSIDLIVFIEGRVGYEGRFERALGRFVGRYEQHRHTYVHCYFYYVDVWPTNIEFIFIFVMSGWKVESVLLTKQYANGCVLSFHHLSLIVRNEGLCLWFLFFSKLYWATINWWVLWCSIGNWQPPYMYKGESFHCEHLNTSHSCEPNLFQTTKILH
jgi:hypothetical protein